MSEKRHFAWTPVPISTPPWANETIYWQPAGYRAWLRYVVKVTNIWGTVFYKEPT